MNWVKELFGSTEKIFDIFNVGRMIFYTTGGLLAIYPLSMTIALLDYGPPESTTGFFGSFKHTMESANPWLLFFAALVSGFLIINMAFFVFVAPGLKRVKRNCGDIKPLKTSINYLYPYLRDKNDDQDYQSWLIKEYFRYVEISIVVPLGFFIGLIFFGAYAVVYLLSSDLAFLNIADILSAIIFLHVIVIGLYILQYYIWPVFWRPQVFDRTIETYIKAKINLVQGVKDHRNNNKFASNATQ